MNYEVIGTEHPEAFAGIEKRTAGHYALPTSALVECPRCRGHGRWNGSRRGDTYQELGCTNCWSWGYVESGSLDATCLHEWDEKQVGNHDHLWTCRNCGRQRAVDSSG